MSLEHGQGLFKQPLEPISGGAPTSAETPQTLSLPKDVGRYLNHLVIDKKSTDSTVSAYRNDLNQLCDFLGISELTRRHDLFWNGVTKERLVAFVGSLQEKGCAQATLSRKVACVKSFFHYLTAEGIVREDPTETLDSPKVVKSLPHILSPEELDRLLAAPEAKSGLEALRDCAMLRLLSETGLRVSELMFLNIDDVDFVNNCISVKGKDDKERINPFGEKTGQLIEDYEETARLYLTRNITHTESSEDPLFVNHRGERLTRAGFWLILKGYATTAGIKGPVSPHTLRHTFAVRLLRNGARLGEVQDLLGHSNISITEQLYRQVARESKGNRVRV